MSGKIVSEVTGQNTSHNENEPSVNSPINSHRPRRVSFFGQPGVISPSENKNATSKMSVEKNLAINMIKSAIVNNAKKNKGADKNSSKEELSDTSKDVDSSKNKDKSGDISKDKHKSIDSSKVKVKYGDNSGKCEKPDTDDIKIKRRLMYRGSSLNPSSENPMNRIYEGLVNSI